MAYEGISAYGDYDANIPEGYPSAGLFNLDAMADEQIVMMGRAFDREHERRCAELGETLGERARNFSEVEDRKTETTAILLEHLGADLAKLAVRDPGRGRSLLMQVAQSVDAYERRIALAAAPPLCRDDYEFGSEMFLAAVGAIRDAPNPDVDEVVSTQSTITRLLPPDLAEDLERRAYERWPYGA